MRKYVYLLSQISYSGLGSKDIKNLATFERENDAQLSADAHFFALQYEINNGNHILMHYKDHLRYNQMDNYYRSVYGRGDCWVGFKIDKVPYIEVNAEEL